MPGVSRVFQSAGGTVHSAGKALGSAIDPHLRNSNAWRSSPTSLPPLWGRRHWRLGLIICAWGVATCLCETILCHGGGRGQVTLSVSHWFIRRGKQDQFQATHNVCYCCKVTSTGNTPSAVRTWCIPHRNQLACSAFPISAKYHSPARYLV